jgi:phosphohistidine phosphatase
MRAWDAVPAREGGVVSEAAGHTLAVLRHAKAVQDPGLADKDRGLTERGLRDAAAAGGWLRGARLIPDLVLCSTAVRTRQTWEQVSAALGPVPERVAVRFDSRLYHTGGAGLLNIVREIPDDAGAVLMVGHNPAFHQLVIDLTGERETAFPTAALAVITMPGAWDDAAPGTGSLGQLWTPLRAR